ncbi:unnamed protein product, partial [Allacma fusca]
YEMGSCYSVISKCIKRKNDNRSSNTGFGDMFSLPQQVREKIWRCLDNESKKMVRQVCSIFKSEIDLGSGLTVEVDSKSPENLNFLKRVEVKKAVIASWNEQCTLKQFRCKWNVEFIRVNCIMGQRVFKSLVLPLNENLVSLSLMDRSLMFSCIISYDMALEVSTKKNNGFLFPRLLALEIQYGHLSSSQQNLQVFNFNMILIMKSFYCPKLMCLVVHPDPNILLVMSEFPDRFPASHLEWENNPLKAFVSLHSESLRLLDLFLYSREVQEDNFNNYKHPAYLEDFVIVIPFVTIAKEFIGQCFWKDIVLESSRLYRLVLQIEFWHNYVDFFCIASMIFEQNARTLTILRLESFALEEENYNDQATFTRNSIGVTISFSILACCTQLKVLEVYQLNPNKNLVAVGLSSLPETLERLETKRIYIPSEEIYLLGNYPNLKKILFYKAGTNYIFGVNYKGLRNLWECPQLKVLQVCGFNFRNNEKKMKKIIQRSQATEVDFSVPGLIVTMKREHMGHIL